MILKTANKCSIRDHFLSEVLGLLIEEFLIRFALRKIDSSLDISRMTMATPNILMIIKFQTFKSKAKVMMLVSRLLIVQLFKPLRKTISLRVDQH